MKFKEPTSRVGVPKLPVTSALPQKYVDEYKVKLHVIFLFVSYEKLILTWQEEMDIDFEFAPIELDEPDFAEGGSVCPIFNS